MLFDIRSGKRRRVVQIVFGFLAILFAVSFIGFGIGGDVSIDPSSIFGGGDENVSSQYEGEIDDAEAALQDDPRDEEALVSLATARVLTGQQELSTNEETRRPEVTDESRAEFDQAFDAWERYLKLDPKPVDGSAASQMIQAYGLVEDFAGAADTQQILADQKPTAQNLFTLSYYRFVDLDVKAGEAAGDEAIAEAKGAEKKQITKSVSQLSNQAAAAQKQIDAQGGGSEAAEQAIEDPFGGLGGGTETAPVAP